MCGVCLAVCILWVNHFSQSKCRGSGKAESLFKRLYFVSHFLGCPGDVQPGNLIMFSLWVTQVTKVGNIHTGIYIKFVRDSKRVGQWMCRNMVRGICRRNGQQNLPKRWLEEYAEEIASGICEKANQKNLLKRWSMKFAEQMVSGIYWSQFKESVRSQRSVQSLGELLGSGKFELAPDAGGWRIETKEGPK